MGAAKAHRGLRRPGDGDARRIKRTAELQRFPGNREATLLRARTQEPLDTEPLKRLTVATLILWGARDPWVPVTDAYQFRDDIKTTTLKVLTSSATILWRKTRWLPPQPLPPS